ncbi:hypothetical protein PVK06_002365 [Gossypium arboreum]|uniref:Uncharacterized protein n=1 Tax=Gossypium arboreum TaxID=29729 RepID=A0ABR0R4K0_GOSAR|nr:hypothetical protein PVK06_002365 [Gossypium arboreum]
MAQKPQMDISFDFQPSLKYIQLYSSTGKPYLLGGQSTVVPSHMHRPRTYEPVADIEAELELEPEPKPELEPDRLHTHSADSSYHQELRVNDYFLGSLGHEYHFEFNIPQKYTPRQHHKTINFRVFLQFKYYKVCTFLF